MVVLAKIYDGGMAAALRPAMMGMRLLIVARVPLSFCSLAKVGIAFWITPH
jgi:hypothetical protein